ncbi:hypothetical protein DPMN_151621 [Dreissena polymorpha]|uniref:Uncharacterized protein n=1 Tax=Dreissena polymorpha TaxID=45954 RepID=A0A9D4FHH5_DREPO|nr:hypothetical protein DPMN_151621 [Dreissena polymorpha]
MLEPNTTTYNIYECVPRCVPGCVPRCVPRCVPIGVPYGDHMLPERGLKPSVVAEQQLTYIQLLTKFGEDQMKFSGKTDRQTNNGAQYVIRTNFLTKFHEDHKRINFLPLVAMFFNRPEPFSNLFQDIIKTNVLTKFHDGWTIHVTFRVPAPCGHVFQATGTVFELVHHVIGTNLLTKYNDDGTINVASGTRTIFHEDVALRVLTTKGPPPGGHVFQPNETFFFKLVQDIIGINLLTKFHEYLKKNLASRVKNAPSSHTNVLTKFHDHDLTIIVVCRLRTWKNAPLPGSHILLRQNVVYIVLTRKNAQPPGCHFHEDWTTNVTFRVLTRTIIELIKDIIGTNLLIKFHEDWTCGL